MIDRYSMKDAPKDNIRGRLAYDLTGREAFGEGPPPAPLLDTNMYRDEHGVWRPLSTDRGPDRG